MNEQGTILIIEDKKSDAEEFGSVLIYVSVLLAKVIRGGMKNAHARVTAAAGSATEPLP